MRIYLGHLVTWTLTLFCLLVMTLVYLSQPTNDLARRFSYKINKEEGREARLQIKLATVACGSLDNIKVMLKSAILFSHDVNLHLILFGDQATIPSLNETVLELSKLYGRSGTRLTYEINPVWFPDDPVTDWMNMYKKCAVQRLFFPSILTHIDSLIFLDADTIVNGNLSKIWLQFGHMDDQQMLGAARDSEMVGLHRYNLGPTGFKFPFFGPTGLNAGVMLMNLTRLRQFDFETKIMAAHEKYKNVEAMHDQHLINILMHDNPSKVRVLSCSHNFYCAHCYTNATFCHAVQKEGIMIIHGAAGTFEANTYGGMFYRTFQAFKAYTPNDSPRLLVNSMNQETNSCAILTGEMLSRNAKEYFTNLNLL